MCHRHCRSGRVRLHLPISRAWGVAKDVQVVWIFFAIGSCPQHKLRRGYPQLLLRPNHSDELDVVGSIPDDHSSEEKLAVCGKEVLFVYCLEGVAVAEGFDSPVARLRGIPGTIAVGKKVTKRGDVDA